MNSLNQFHDITVSIPRTILFPSTVHRFSLCYEICAFNNHFLYSDMLPTLDFILVQKTSVSQLMGTRERSGLYKKQINKLI